MFGTTLTTIIIAVLSGVGAYYAWNSSRGVTIALGVVCILASASAFIAAFIGALAVVFKILPLLLLALGAWLVWRSVSKKNKSVDRTV